MHIHTYIYTHSTSQLVNSRFISVIRQYNKLHIMDPIVSRFNVLLWDPHEDKTNAPNYFQPVFDPDAC